MCAGRTPSTSGSDRLEALAFFHRLASKDFAVGYLLTVWLVRTAWALAPAIAAILGLPAPTAHASGRKHLPAFITFLLGGLAPKGKEWLMDPRRLDGLVSALVGPTAALASYAGFRAAEQTLVDTGATRQQVGSIAETMPTEPERSMSLPRLRKRVVCTVSCWRML